MRPSKKTKILAAAVALIERENLEAVAYEALAEASGMSKSGIVYPLPITSQDYARVHQHLADPWEEKLQRAAGSPAASVGAKTCLRTVVLSQSNNATKAELLFEIEARSKLEFSAIWGEVNDRWVPSTKCWADGLWKHDYVHEPELTPAQREALTNQILQMLG